MLVGIEKVDNTKRVKQIYESSMTENRTISLETPNQEKSNICGMNFWSSE